MKQRGAEPSKVTSSISMFTVNPRWPERWLGLANKLMMDLILGITR